MKAKFLLFLYSFLIIFLGMTLTNIFSCFIYGLQDGDVTSRIIELPYLLYAVFSLIISAVLFLFDIQKKINYINYKT